MSELRVPPHSIHAEQAVIGGLMLVNQSWDWIADSVVADDFYRSDHQLIFQAIEGLARRNKPFDVVTLSERLEATGGLEDAGGLAYLATLAKDTPSAANIRAHAQIVREHSIRRRLMAVASQMLEGALQQSDPAALINTVEIELLKAAEHSPDEAPQKTGSLMDGYLDAVQDRADGKAASIKTGFLDFDQKTNGFAPGQFIVLGARPGMGKTSLVLNIAENAALQQKKPVLFFSLEMTRQELMDRLVAAVGGIPLSSVLKGDLSAGDFSGAVRKLKQAPLFLDDTGGLTVAQIRSRARRLKRRHGLDLLIVDYLQLVRTKAENRFQEVSEISRALKALAKELHVPIIALSQLSRAVEDRPNKRPRMSDLRESGQLEQDADLIAFIYRDEIYNAHSKTPGVAELLIEKQRNGPTGKVYLATQLDLVRFKNHAGPVNDAPPQKRFEY